MQFEQLSDGAKKIVEIYKEKLSNFYDPIKGIRLDQTSEDFYINMYHIFYTIGLLVNSEQKIIIYDIRDAYYFCYDRNFFYKKN